MDIFAGLSVATVSPAGAVSPSFRSVSASTAAFVVRGGFVAGFGGGGGGDIGGGCGGGGGGGGGGGSCVSINNVES
jgi:hypothetical protein